MQNLEHQKETLLEEELYNQIDQPQKTITFAKNTKAENTLESLNSELHSENITPQINGFQRKQGFGTCFENFQSKHQEAMLIHQRYSPGSQIFSKLQTPQEHYFTTNNYADEETDFLLTRTEGTQRFDSKNPSTQRSSLVNFGN